MGIAASSSSAAPSSSSDVWVLYNTTLAQADPEEETLKSQCLRVIRMTCATLLDPNKETVIGRWVDDPENPKLNPEEVQVFRGRDDFADLCYLLFLTREPTASCKKRLEEIRASDLTEEGKKQAYAEVESGISKARSQELQSDFNGLYKRSYDFDVGLSMGYEVYNSITTGGAAARYLEIMDANSCFKNLSHDILAALALGDSMMSKLLLQNPYLDDFSPLTREEAINQAFVLASMFGQVQKMKELISVGVDPKSSIRVGSYDFDAMQVAAVGGHLEVVQLLVEHEVDPRYNNTINSPLNLAARWGHKPVVEWLSACGAYDPNEDEFELKLALHFFTFGQNLRMSHS